MKSSIGQCCSEYHMHQIYQVIFGAAHELAGGLMNTQVLIQWIWSGAWVFAFSSGAQLWWCHWLKDDTLRTIRQTLWESLDLADDIGWVFMVFKGIDLSSTKIMSSGPITSWQIDEETMKTVTDFIFLGSKITGDGDCSHEIKRCLLLGRRLWQT